MKTILNALLTVVTLTGATFLTCDHASAATFTNLYTFSALDENGFNGDGADSVAALTASGQTLYGTASTGGAAGGGTIFAINTDGTGFTNLYSFTNFDTPTASLILFSNKLYGTTRYGGSNSSGSVFAINTDGTGFTNLYSFTESDDNGFNEDGELPFAGLILFSNTLYGTTFGGGTNGNGVIFAINTDGTGFTNLYTFGGGTDGYGSQAPLMLSGNTLYGTTSEGGLKDGGTVFRINTDGTAYTNLTGLTANSVSFTQAGLVIYSNILYGVSYGGGTAFVGTIFSLKTDGSDFTYLYNFPQTPHNTYTNGANPAAALLLSGHTLYGTTTDGGLNGSGNVFAINIDGTGFAALYSFTARDVNRFNNDGALPYSSLVLSANSLYGTTSAGGSAANGNAV